MSPTSGIVTTPSREVKEKEGQYVNRGDLVAEVQDLETIVAEIAVAEWETADVKPNQRVRVRARAYPGVEFEGHVSAIAATVTPRDPAVTWNRDRVILVTTALENHSLRLKPGMNGYAKISGGPRRIIDLLTRRLSGFRPSSGIGNDQLARSWSGLASVGRSAGRCLQEMLVPSARTRNPRG